MQITLHVIFIVHVALGEPSVKVIRVITLIRLYGSETWTLTKAQEKSLDWTYTKMLRIVLGISWKDKVSNITLYIQSW